MSDAAVLRQLALAAADTWSEFIRGCTYAVGEIGQYDSPIEYAMALALEARRRTNCLAETGFAFYQPLRGPLQSLATEPRTVETMRAHCAANIAAHEYGGIFPQVQIENYRVDFLLLHTVAGGGFAGIVVECDGHDFHERTKHQAIRDKTRDRRLQELGYRVLRFTGSEIWRDAFKCADQVIWMAINGAQTAGKKIA